MSRGKLYLAVLGSIHTNPPWGIAHCAVKILRVLHEPILLGQSFCNSYCRFGTTHVSMLPKLHKINNSRTGLIHSDFNLMHDDRVSQIGSIALQISVYFFAVYPYKETLRIRLRFMMRYKQ